MTCTTNQEVTELPRDVRDATFIVIAAYNEGSCLADVVREVRGVYPQVVVVDDGSTDDTYEAAERSATYVLRHAINRGQGAALQTGIRFALLRGAEYVVTFDADGQHRVQDIRALVTPICQGDCQITLGSRFLGGTENLPASRRRYGSSSGPLKKIGKFPSASSKRRLKSAPISCPARCLKPGHWMN